ncbi:MAG: HEAT repeat domain-containing protein [Bacteroidota bacterium]
MYNQIIFLLFKLKLLQPSKNRIDIWTYSGETEKLETALIHGNYRTRELAARGLSIAGKSSSKPVLLAAISDPVHKVSIAAMNTLETLDQKKELIKPISNKRLDWFKYYSNKNKDSKEKKKGKHNIYRWERTSKKNFELVKERLKRPIR